MAVPKPPAFDAKSFATRLSDAIKKPDGTVFPVFGQFTSWKLWADGQRDVLASHDIQLADHKSDLDAHTERLNKQADRLAVLEARPSTSPFPGS